MNQCINRYGSHCLSPGRFVPNRKTDITWIVGAILSLAPRVTAATGIHKSCQLNQFVLICRNVSAPVCCHYMHFFGLLTGLLHFVTNRHILCRSSIACTSSFLTLSASFQCWWLVELRDCRWCISFRFVTRCGAALTASCNFLLRRQTSGAFC